MPSLQSLRPALTRAEAIDKFQRGMSGLLHRLGRGPLRAVADAYLPFRLYDVEMADGRSRQRSFFALDAVSGTLDLYQFERVPTDELIEIETRHRPEPGLDDAQAFRALEDKLRRLLFQRGFFFVREVRIRAERVALDLHVPYWIGFHGGEDSLRLRVLDAVRGRFEGGKARALFEAWLAGRPLPR